MNRTYIGDGVYAERDKNIDQIWLSTDRYGDVHTIALGVAELRALNAFAEQSWAPAPPPAGDDIEFNYHGTVGILVGSTDAGLAWLGEHLQEGVQRWGTNGYVVEPRYVADIIQGAREDGLRVKI